MNSEFRSAVGEVLCPGYQYLFLPAPNLGRREVTGITARQSWQHGRIVLFGDVTIEGETFKAAAPPHENEWTILPLGEWEGEFRTWRDVTALYWN